MTCSSRRRFATLAAVLLALLAGAVALDGPVARWVDRERPIPRRNKPVYVRVVKAAGDFKYVAVAIAAVAVLHPARWRAGALLLASAALAGTFYGSKWFFGRRRPSTLLEPFTFEPFTDGLPGFFYAKALSFPSGHACLSFAAASCLAVLLPRGAVAFYGVAVIVGVERVLEGAHYPSDVVAGAALGLLSTFLALRLAARWFGPDGLKTATAPPLAQLDPGPAEPAGARVQQR